MIVIRWRLRSFFLRVCLTCGCPVLALSGENSIIIVGGANQAQWGLSEPAQAAIQGAGAVLLQREIPEDVNIQVAKVRDAAPN